MLPEHRIVAFYGSPVTPRLGILGTTPPDSMLALLQRMGAAWQAADPGTPVQLALEPIVVQASGLPGRDSLYRIRLPDHEIRRVLGWADSLGAIVVMDVQLGRSSLERELPRLIPYLEKPNVDLGLDPEWAMQGDHVPGRVIGTMDASQINMAIALLDSLVEARHLPPKLLIVHRFTHSMVTHADSIRMDDPAVQVVMVMDGWGSPPLKRSTYRDFIASAPVPFTGFKLFFRNDRWRGSHLMTPLEVLALHPAPFFIQYQ